MLSKKCFTIYEKVPGNYLCKISYYRKILNQCLTIVIEIVNFTRVIMA